MSNVRTHHFGIGLLAALAVSSAIAAPTTDEATRRKASRSPSDIPQQNSTAGSSDNRPRFSNGGSPSPSLNTSGPYVTFSPGLGIVDGRADSPDYKKESFGAKLVLGMQFSPLWSLEFGYVDFGKGKSFSSARNYEQSSKGVFLVGANAFELGSTGFDFLIRYGLSYIENHEIDRYRGGNSKTNYSSDGKEKKTGGYLGLGGRYRFGPNYSLGLDIDVGADTSMLVGISNRWQF